MISMFRRNLNPATVIAVVALVFALTGGAYAAGKYVITSKSQIKPSVLKALTGANGANGANGSPGAPGSPGTNGTNGTNGQTGFTETLPAGKSLMGTWSTAAITGPSALALEFAPISFQFPLSTALPEANVHFIALGDETGTGPCAGTINAPTAQSGHLCVYTSEEEIGPSSSAVYGGVAVPKPGKSGAILKFTITGLASANGTWVVTN
jgi:hypothetical protein